MPNTALKGKMFPIPMSIINDLELSLIRNRNKVSKTDKGVKRAHGFIEKKQISYEELNRLKNFFTTFDGENQMEYILSGGDLMRIFVFKALKQLTNVIDGVKRTRMNAGEENQFKRTHSKDSSKNPTKVRIPKLHKGKVSDQIRGGQVRYESIGYEIDSMKYLIEYMNNKNKII